MKHPVKLIYEGPAYLIVLVIAFLSVITFMAAGIPIESILTFFQALVA
jgi:hypothetical protein